jgi:hypothetical protein
VSIRDDGSNSKGRGGRTLEKAGYFHFRWKYIPEFRSRSTIGIREARSGFGWLARAVEKKSLDGIRRVSHLLGVIRTLRQ